MVEQSYANVFKKLQRQAVGDFGDANMDAAAQNSGMARAPVGYGVFAQGLAGALQAGAQDPAFGAASEYALREYADQERAAIGQMSEADRQAAFAAKIIPALIQKGLDPNGVLSQINMGTDSPLGQYGKLFDPVTIMADAAVRRHNDVATGHRTTAEGLKAARDAGVAVDEPSVEQAFANPITGQGATGYGLFTGNLTPDEQSDRITADAAMKRADADMIDVRNPLKYNRKSGGSGSSGDGVQSSIIVPIPGLGMATLKGKNPDAVRAAAEAARGGDAQTSSRVEALTRVAKQRGLSVAPRTGGGIVIQNGRSQLHYDAKGNRVAK